MEIFAERLKELRIEKGLSQMALSKCFDFISQSAIAHWETGDRVPTAEAVVLLAKFFGVTTDYLLGVSDD
ncbi:MAG: helix-turn-helix domain-containing protein [Firmicutes bacterium]|nr:helix-turn-helix domain-containing protein [Bacillota bacterium]